jgi:hypothetical protein
VGLLVGAAAVGIGVGVMQIPEEQRVHVKNKAVKAVHQAHESAISASEAISTSCATSCHDIGCIDHFPSDMKEFLRTRVPRQARRERLLKMMEPPNKMPNEALTNGTWLVD